MSAESSPTLDPAILERARRPVVHSVPGMDRVTVHRDVPYLPSADPRLRMDIYVPELGTTNAKHPVVVLLHGAAPGPLPMKDMGAFRSWGRLLAAHGMVAVTFTHRLQWPVAQVDEAIADVRAAIGYVRASADKYGVDDQRMCLAAWSAGGALLSIPLVDDLSFVRCQVAFYPMIELQPPGKPAVSLRSHLDDEHFPPLFIAPAGRDATPGLKEQLDGFIAAALAANVPLQVVNHPRGNHGFDIDNDDRRSREVIAAAIAFMQAHLETSGYD